MQRLQLVTYRADQTNGIIYLHENMRNERLMQKETPITDPLCKSAQCPQTHLIVRPKDSPETLSEWQSLVRALPPVRNSASSRPTGGPKPGWNHEAVWPVTTEVED